MNSKSDGNCKPIQMTQLLNEWQNGNEAPLHEVIHAIYPQLRRMARSFLAKRPPSETFPPTVLVHEAFLKFRAQVAVEWQNRGHFFAIVALTMRRVYLDYLKEKRRAKRGPESHLVTLPEDVGGSPPKTLDFNELNQALQDFRKVHPRQALIAALKFFGGFLNSEMAAMMEISEMTVRRDWRFAKAWLTKRLKQQKSLLV